MNSPVILRSHTAVFDEAKKRKKRLKRSRYDEKWPLCLLVFDCETRTDEKQALTFGWYRIIFSDEDGQYTKVTQEGIFYDPEELIPAELAELRNFAKRKAETANDVSNEIRVHTRESFLKNIFLPFGLQNALIVGFNLPFDISRIVMDAREARRLNDDWSFVMLAEPFAPRIVVTRKDGKIAFFRFSGVGRDPKTGKKVRIPRGRFLDVHTLAWSLRNVTYSLDGLCQALKIPGKIDHKATGEVTEREIEYARQDVKCTVGALNRLRAEFERYPIDLNPDNAFSPASIVKAYFRKMGLSHPSKKFRISPRMQGICAQSFYGGRAECRIRHTPLPVVHTDFKSEYPTVIVRMGLWRILTARTLRIETATKEIKQLLEKVTLDQLFKPGLWKQFTCFALVQPEEDVLPVRAEFNPDTGEDNLGINRLSSQKPIWYALPDLIASKLLTGKSPNVIRAVRVIPKGQQSGLQVTTLGGMRFNPRTDDFFKIVIEARERAKRDTRLSGSDREALGYFLKIMANSGYGIFIETTPKFVPAGTEVEVFSGEFSFPTTSEIVEDKGPWYCPLVASLVTSGGRLLLAMLETTVTVLGGAYVFADTDSMAIVATKHGGILPCVGGSHRLPDGRDAVKALSWNQVKEITEVVPPLVET